MGQREGFPPVAVNAPQDKILAPQLCGSVLGGRPHVCAFFRDAEEQDRALLPFIKEGLAAGERIVQAIDPLQREDSIRRLSEAGIDFSTAHCEGRFDLHDWTETHLIGGKFDPDRTLALSERAALTATQRGFPRTRFIGHMEWALGRNDLSVDLLAYEAKANQLWMRPSGGRIDPVVCVYDLRRFGAELVIDIIRAHPMVLIGGVLNENPFFVPPAQLLLELNGKR